MEKLYFKYSGKIFLMFLFLLLFFVRGASAQTTLAQGDVSVIGFNASSSDNFAFVPWVDLAVNTEIRFTDNAFNSTAASGAGGNYRAQEAEIIWKNNTGATIQAGTVITVFNDAANINTATNIGQIVSVSVTTNGNATSLNLTNTSGDQIFIYQGSSNVLPGTVSSTFTGTIIFGLGFSGSGVASTTWLSTGASTGSTSYLPGDLLAANQVFLGPNAWGGEYTGARNGLSSLAAYKALVTNPANWNKITTGVISPFNLTSFSSGPIISGQPANRTICVNSTTTFNVTSDATSYQWQVSTDGGNNFSNITNTAPYSGVTTNTLTITAAPATLSGFRYRVVATNASGSVNSNSGTLAISNMVSSVTSQTNIACFGSLTGAATVGVSGGVAPYTYSWSPSGGTASSATGLGAGTYTVTITDNIGCTKTQTVNIAQPATGITTTGSQTNVSCNGGSNGTATVTATGGTGTYTYSWSPSGGTAATASGLVGGAAYTVTVTDANGCTATRTFNIMQPAVLAATTLQTNVSCNGGANGTATAVPSGGAGGYTYAWLPSGATTATASGLGVGNHTVTITDANACTTTRTVTITQPSLLNTSPARTNVACNGGSNGVAAISASGGTFPYTYLWSNGATTSAITGLTAGDYTVTVTDGNSCTSTKTITITQPSLLTATTSQTNVSCKGGTNGTATVVPAGGAGGYTYAWLPSGATTATATGLGVGNHTVTITDANSCTITKTVTLTEPATAITSTGSQTNVSCNGGSNGTATVTATGGTGTYTYSWSPSGGTAATASGLLAGAYTVTITDANGCTATRTFNITQPAALAATTSQTNLFCNGVTTGNASVSVTGGIGAYSYSWSPSGGTASSATGLGAGTYTVTITDANNCILTKTITITQPAALVVTPSHTNVSCNGGSNGSATAVVTGGTGAYTYSWSPSGGTAATASGLTAGTYTVTIKDANLCQTTQSYTITEPAVLAATPSQTNVSCNGGSNGTATVTVTGGTGAYSYAWSPTGGTGASATGLTAGTYIVTIKDANLCQTTQSFTITGPAAITSTGSQTNVSCNGGSNGTATVTATGGTGAYTYSWAPSGGTAATASGLLAGAYTVTITDANGCTATRNFNITQPTALAATTSQTNLLCYGGANGTASVSVTGGTGAYSYSWSPSGGTASSATGLGAGTYTVTIKDANNCILTKTITITQPTALAITPSHTNVSCNGGSNGSATAVVTGGTGAYTYSWSPSGGTAATASGLTAGTYTVIIKDANLCQITQSYTITEPAVLAVTPSQTNVLCNGSLTGTATVAVTGGTGAYSYAWSPTGGTGASATGLGAGTYTVTIKDANLCQITQGFTITQPAVLTATAAQSNVLCNGGTTGSAAVTAAGGTGPYTYSWAPSGGTAAVATGLAAGTYTVTIKDANLCSITKSFTITQPSALAVTPSQTNVACNGSATGSASVSVTGGTGAYSYVWAPSGGTAATASGLIAGTYTVTIKDANLCQTMQSFTISQPVPIALTATTLPQAQVANVYNANLSATGGVGTYTYSVTSGTLPNGLSLSPAGVISGTPTISGTFNFDVKVTDSGCGQSSTLSFSITAITSDQTITFTAIPTQTFGNTPVTLAATSTSGLTVSFASDNAAVATVAGNVLTINGAGTANITASQAGGSGYNPAPDIVKVLTVNKATASIALSNLSYIYDGTAKAATVVTTPAGLSGVSVTYNGSATLPKAAGTYAVVASLNNTNYTAPNATGSLVIAPKAITVSADAKSKTYGSADPALTYSVPAGSLVGTDAITGSLNRAPGETVGTYAIGQNTLTAGNNYTITYAPANLSIGTKSITVSADAKSKTYGSADPALTYSVPAGSLVGTDAITGSLNRVTGENVGTYAIGQNTLTAGNNYTITYAPANLTIGRKTITVTADAKSKTYGSADPALTYSVPAGSLVGTDAITGSLNRAPGENVGTYAIGQNTLTAGNNYTITYNTANLTINPKALTITADGKTRVFGVANPALTVSYSGFITGESSTVLTSAAVISTTATITSPSGTYPITASGAAAANYSISYVPGSLVITATSQSITFAALANKLSTDAPFTLTATATSGLAVSYSSSDVSVARIINGNQVEILKAGVVTITASQAGNGNYTAAAAVNQSLTVLDNPAPIISIVSSKGNSISKGITTVLTASGALTYSWSNASGIISGQNTASLTVRPAQTTTYTVTGANQYGRTSTQSITIEVLADYKALNITNALSPNGDGVNDFWIVENIDMYPNNTVKIVDRSGRSVYEKKGYDNSWDGNFRGAQLAEGTYYYIIDFGPGIGFRKGFITIVR